MNRAVYTPTGRSPISAPLADPVMVHFSPERSAAPLHLDSWPPW